MKYFHREIAKEINREAGRINHVFGTRYHWSLIKNPVHFAIVYKYIYRNPIEAGISKHVEEYPFSTVQGKKLNTFKFLDTSFVDVHIPNDYQECLQWLNTPYKQKCVEAIRKGIRRTEFCIPKDKNGSQINIKL